MNSRWIRLVIFIGALVAAFIYYYRPFLVGKMFADSEDKTAGYFYLYKLGYHIRVPDYALDSAKWINEQSEPFRILVLPDDKTNVYDWGYGAAGDITHDIFKKGILFRQYGEGMAPPSFIEALYSRGIKLLYEGRGNKSTEFSDVMRLLNVKYILIRGDFLYDFFGDIDSPSFLRQRLSEQTGIKKAKQFGKWEFYEVDGFFPRVEAFPKFALLVAASHRSLPNSYESKAGSEPIVTLGHAAFDKWHAAKQQRSSNKVVANTSEEGRNCAPRANFKQVASTHYDVVVEGAACAFLLVLNSSFHSDWQAFEKNVIQDANVPRQQLSQHTIVNEYANGWLVPAGEQPQRVFEIEYRPQNFVRIGTIISIITIVLILFAWAVWRAFQSRSDSVRRVDET